MMAGSDSCDALQHTSTFNFVLSIGILAGVIGSFVPQHIKIVRRRSSEGISPKFLLFGTTSGIFAVTNVVILSADIFVCCRVISGLGCFASLLGVLQMGFQLVMSAGIIVLVIVFAHNSPFQPPEDYAKIVRAGWIVLTEAIVCVTVSIYLMATNRSQAIAWANVLGIASAALAIAQYLPQLWTTYHLKHTGTLSIPMMCIQSPGGLIWSASLAARPGTKWTSWAGYLAAALLQLTLLIMAVYFETRRKHEIADVVTTTVHDDETQADEWTPLTR